MDGLQDETKQVDEGTAQQTQDASAQVSGDAGAAADGGIAQARADYEAALKERDARIAELEGEIAEAAKTAEGAEALRKEMDELRRRGDEERVGFELQLAGARNVKAARALLSDYDNDVEKLRAAERGRRRDRRGHADEPLAQDCRPSRERGVADGNSIAYTKNYTAVLDEVYKRAVCSTCLNSLRRMARGMPCRGDCCPQDRGDEARRLHPQRGVQDGVDHLRVRDQDCRFLR